tara:strand:- start:1160 stop:2200 length:1041 start_codon:yes stop_codon:yes gene_type:complete
MRGEVEVWSGDDLILKEANMLTDGAGELLADIMTVSPSLATIEDHATSSILDTSNYTIQAISFGTGSEGFRSNGHKLVDVALVYEGADVFAGTKGNQTVLRSNRDDEDASNVNQPADPGFPIAPTPELDVLEINTSVDVFISKDVSAIIPGNGQLTNFIPSAIMSSTFEGTELSTPVRYFGAASVLGCFPDGSSAPHATRNQVKYYDNAGTQQTITSLGGYFNEVSSMDASGFVNSVSGTATTSGLTTSSNVDFSTNGTIEYAVTLSKSDALFAHAYGGIFHLGLWTIDMNESLMNGNTPPFAFSVLDNPRKYRLFCRKGVSKDLTYIEDISAYQDLTIKWRLHFL